MYHATIDNQYDQTLIVSKIDVDDIFTATRKAVTQAKKHDAFQGATELTFTVWLVPEPKPEPVAPPQPAKQGNLF